MYFDFDNVSLDNPFRLYLKQIAVRFLLNRRLHRQWLSFKTTYQLQTIFMLENDTAGYRTQHSRKMIFCTETKLSSIVNNFFSDVLIVVQFLSTHNFSRNFHCLNSYQEIALDIFVAFEDYLSYHCDCKHRYHHH